MLCALNKLRLSAYPRTPSGLSLSNLYYFASSSKREGYVAIVLLHPCFFKHLDSAHGFRTGQSMKLPLFVCPPAANRNHIPIAPKALNLPGELLPRRIQPGHGFRENPFPAALKICFFFCPYLPKTIRLFVPTSRASRRISPGAETPLHRHFRHGRSEPLNINPHRLVRRRYSDRAGGVGHIKEKA